MNRKLLAVMLALDTLAGADAGHFDGFEETKKGCQLRPN